MKTTAFFTRKKKLYPSLCPIASVEVTIADGFGDVVRLDFL